VALGCSESGDAPPAPGVGGSGQTSGAGGTGAGTAGATGGGTGGTAGATPGGASGSAGTPAGGTAGSGGSAGGDVGGSAGSGGSAGGVSAFTPCSTAPAAEVPELVRGDAIGPFDGMDTAGQIVGVPGEANIIYVIGHKDGNVFTVQDGQIADTPLVSVDVASGGNNEQGLLSMALHPDFATNQLFYLFYTAPDGDMTIDEFMRTTPTSATFVQNVYSNPREGGGQFHNGGMITFDPTDTTKSLFFSVGNTESNNAGVPDGTVGRVLRIDVAAKSYETYVYGLRNPYRMSIDRLTGDMYIADVSGPPGGTIIVNGAGDAGTDFGYRDNNGSPDVNDGVLRDGAGSAIIGGFVYRGNKIPGLCGRYFFGNWADGTVKSIVVENGNRVGDPVMHDNLTLPTDITSFGEDGEGELYMAGMNNTIYKILPAQ
jgi:glucose/arabinose dehydrogenase